MSDQPETVTLPRTRESAVKQVTPPAGATAIPKILEDPVQAAAEEKERETAFNAEFSWNDKKLHGFSMSRYSLFAQHRVAMGAPDLGAVLNDADGFLADAIRIIWLCSHLPVDWALLRANPGRFEAVIEQWADENIQPGQQAAAVLLGMNLYGSAFTNQHEAAPLPRTPSSDDSGN